MINRMDTIADFPSFDLQSTHVSFEERRWIFTQRKLYKLDDLVQSIVDLHKTIRGHEQFSLIPTSLSSSTMIDKVHLNEKLLYYISLENGKTDNEIDQFRLHYQQMFQLIFNDLCTDLNYRILIIIIEGFLFYSAQTSQEYIASLTNEMSKCLTSFTSYIQTRCKKITDFISCLSSSSLPSYTLVHTNFSNNIGILFQLLPKIHYLKPTTEHQSIVTIDEYDKHTISPEELRCIDYIVNMKHQRHTGTVHQSSTSLFSLSNSATGGGGSIALFPDKYEVLHSLSIVYPYDNNEVYSQKYPSFWTGDNHTNENSDKLFQTIAIEKNSLEFLFVQRLFHKTIPEKEVNIAIIERIQNAHLWEKFCSHRSYMRRKNGIDNLNEGWLFHGTKSDNHHHIMSHGFNRSYCKDTVFFGRGVYFSRYACYSSHYADRKDLSFLFLCRVLVGHHTAGSNDLHVPPMINLTNGKQIQADSTTDKKSPYTIVCTFHDDQNYPQYIITYMDKVNVH